LKALLEAAPTRLADPPVKADAQSETDGKYPIFWRGFLANHLATWNQKLLIKFGLS